MKLFPAIDLYEGKCVRLQRGDYHKMTVYSDDPVETALGFAAAGAEYLHVVDLQGARSGGTPNYETICRLIALCGLKTQVGGGVRDVKTARRYLDAGAFRVILGTAAAEPGAAREFVRQLGDQVAVGADIRDGFVAIRGWTEVTDLSLLDFCAQLDDAGIRTVICTDISKDGMLAGANRQLYELLCSRFNMNFIASGGVSSLEDVRAFSRMGLAGAILGRALYEKAVDLKEALREARA